MVPSNWFGGHVEFTHLWEQRPRSALGVINKVLDEMEPLPPRTLMSQSTFFLLHVLLLPHSLLQIYIGSWQTHFIQRPKCLNRFWIRFHDLWLFRLQKNLRFNLDFGWQPYQGLIDLAVQMDCWHFSNHQSEVAVPVMQKFQSFLWVVKKFKTYRTGLNLIMVPFNSEPSLKCSISKFPTHDDLTNNFLAVKLSVKKRSFTSRFSCNPNVWIGVLCLKMTCTATGRAVQLAMQLLDAGKRQRTFLEPLSAGCVVVPA